MSGRKIILHARMEYSLWITNPRMSILLVLLVLIHSMVIQPLAQAGGQIGARFHLLEPLAALCNSTLIQLILPIGFLILMAGFPRMERGFLLQLYRVGRLNWVLGELLHLAMAAATYLAVVLAGTMLCSLPYAPTAGPGWSAVATDYTAILEDAALKTVAMLLPKNLYQQMGPGAAVTGSLLLLFLCLMLNGRGSAGSQPDPGAVLGYRRRCRPSAGGRGVRDSGQPVYVGVPLRPCPDLASFHALSPHPGLPPVGELALFPAGDRPGIGLGLCRGAAAQF